MLNAKRIFSDFKVFRSNYMRNRTALFFALIFPVILILIFGAIFSNSSGTVTVYAQNLDTGPFQSPQANVASQFLLAVNSSNVVNVVSVAPSENFTQYLADHSASDGILIPAGFSANYIAGKAVNVTVYGNPTSSSSSIVKGTVDGCVNYFNLHRLNGSAVINTESATVNSGQTKYVDFLIPGLLGFSILVGPMFSLVNLSSEYKRTKLFKQLSLTPLTKMEWLISKILMYILVSTISFLLMVAVGSSVFGANITVTAGVIPFLIIGPTLFASLGMLV
jgi:ABC-2 type transport system permease protein